MTGCLGDSAPSTEEAPVNQTATNLTPWTRSASAPVTWIAGAGAAGAWARLYEQGACPIVDVLVI